MVFDRQRVFSHSQRTFLFTFFLIAILTSITTTFDLSALAADEGSAIKISGSSTTYAVLKPIQSKVEDRTHLKIDISPSSTGGGIVDLCAGKSAMAMTSEPLDIALEAGKQSGAGISPDDHYEIFPVTVEQVAYVVHPDNPVVSLSWTQMRELLTGRIHNWKDLGGKDLPIHIYAEKLGRGTRAMVQKVIMRGLDYSKDARFQDTIDKTTELVSGDPAGFAIVGPRFAEKFAVKRVKSEPLSRPIGFVIKGKVTENEQKVIEAYKELLRGHPRT